MKLQRLKRILSEDKKWLSSYVNKASDKNVKDAVNMMKRSKDMSDDEFSRENARINRRTARIQKTLPKVKLESFNLMEANIYNLILLEDRIDFLKNQFAGKLDTSHDSLAQHRDSNDIVDHFANNADPTKNKAHTQWILKQYQQKNVRQEDHPRIKSALENFEKYKAKLPNRDINSYKSVGEVENAVSPHISSGEPVSKRQEVKKVKDEGSELLSSENGISVRKLKTKEAACHYGKGTKWCTAAEKNNNMFDHYNKKGPIYYIEGRNKNGEIRKHQYHPASNQFMDEYDKGINVPDFVKRNPEITKHKELEHLKAHDEKNHEDIVNDENSDDKMLKIVGSMSDDPFIRQSIINHKNAGDKTLSALAEKWKDHPFAHEDILKHENVGSHTLFKISDLSNDPTIHRIIANHPNLDSETALALSIKSKDPEVHKKIAKHAVECPYATSEDLDLLINNSDDSEIHRKVLRHHNVDSYNLANLAIKSNDPRIHKDLLNHKEYRPRGLLSRLLAKKHNLPEESDKEVVSRAIDDHIKNQKGNPYQLESFLSAYKRVLKC